MSLPVNPRRLALKGYWSVSALLRFGRISGGSNTSIPIFWCTGAPLSSTGVDGACDIPNALLFPTSCTQSKRKVFAAKARAGVLLTCSPQSAPSPPPPPPHHWCRNPPPPSKNGVPYTVVVCTLQCRVDSANPTKRKGLGRAICPNLLAPWGKGGPLSCWAWQRHIRSTARWPYKGRYRFINIMQQRCPRKPLVVAVLGVPGLGDLKIALRGGGGGDMDARRRRGEVGEMGFRVGPFVLCNNGCWRQRRRNTNFGPKKFFPPIIPPQI